MAAMMSSPLGRIGGTPGQGCMGRPGSIPVSLTGEQMAALADIALELGPSIQDVAALLLVESMQRYARNTSHETGES